MRDDWEAFRGARQGERFREHYRRLREHGSLKLRIAALAVAAVLAAGGVFLLFFPGPGLLLIAFALGLASGESQTLARGLDRAEPPVRRLFARARQRIRPRR
jgi:hypothetical protein